MRHRSIALIGCTLAFCGAAGFIAPAYGQGPAELLYSPDRFLQAPSLHPGFRFEPAPGAPTPDPPAPTADVEPPPTKPVTLRAGIVEEIVDEPGKIRTGEVTWGLETSVTGEPFARGHMRIGKATALEITVVRRHPTHGAITISVVAGGGLGFEPTGLSMPRMRRTAAAEGEPLLGRVQRRGANNFVIELSDQPVDLENNLDRLLTRPWLDLIFRRKRRRRDRCHAGA